MIQNASIDADYLIDLHTADEAVHHLFTFEECLHSSTYFDIPYIILLDHSFSGVLDEAFLQPWLRLCEAFQIAGRYLTLADLGVEAFTLELGNADETSDTMISTDTHRIMNYLRHKNILHTDTLNKQKFFISCKAKDYVRYYAPSGGILTWNLELGREVKIGDKVATLLNAKTGEKILIRSADNGIFINRTQSHVVHEGMRIFAIMTEVRKQIINE